MDFHCLAWRRETYGLSWCSAKSKRAAWWKGTLATAAACAFSNSVPQASRPCYTRDALCFACHAAWAPPKAALPLSLSQTASKLELTLTLVPAKSVHASQLWWQSCTCCWHEPWCLSCHFCFYVNLEQTQEIPQDLQALRMKRRWLSTSSMVFSSSKAGASQRPFLLSLLQSSRKMHTINLCQPKLPLLTGPSMIPGNKV